MFNALSVSAKTHNTNDNLYRKSDFLYKLTVNLDYIGDRVSEDKATMDEFLKDLTSFKKYTIKLMNLIEVEISVISK